MADTVVKQANDATNAMFTDINANIFGNNELKSLNPEDLERAKTIISILESRGNLTKANFDMLMAEKDFGLKERQLNLAEKQLDWSGGLMVGKEVLAAGQLIAQSLLQDRMLDIQDRIRKDEKAYKDKLVTLETDKLEATKEIQKKFIEADVKKTKYTEATKVAKAKIAASVAKARDKNQALKDLYYRKSYGYGNH